MTGPELGVKGFPFQQGSTYFLHKKNLKSNILCKKHNVELSPVDQAGIDVFKAIRTMTASGAPRKIKINGLLFERWLLKTLINIEVVSDFTLKPSSDIVERAFGKAPFPDRSGLFFVGSTGTRFNIEDRLGYRRKIFQVDGSNHLGAATFIVCGLEFLFALGEPQFAPGFIPPMYHPHRINCDGTSIVFGWSRRTTVPSRRR